MFKSKASKPVQGLFQITVKVGRGSNADMPSSLAGAIIPAYAVAEDWQDAAKRAVANLVSQGFEFLDIQGTIAQLDPAGWADYVAKVWPECASSLPT